MCARVCVLCVCAYVCVHVCVCVCVCVHVLMRLKSSRMMTFALMTHACTCGRTHIGFDSRSGSRRSCGRSYHWNT